MTSHQCGDRPKDKGQGKHRRDQAESDGPDGFIFRPGNTLVDFDRILGEHLHATGCVRFEDQQFLTADFAEFHAADWAPTLGLPREVFHAVNLNRAVRGLHYRRLGQHQPQRFHNRRLRAPAGEVFA